MFYCFLVCAYVYTYMCITCVRVHMHKSMIINITSIDTTKIPTHISGNSRSRLCSEMFKLASLQPHWEWFWRVLVLFLSVPLARVVFRECFGFGG